MKTSKGGRLLKKRAKLDTTDTAPKRKTDKPSGWKTDAKLLQFKKRTDELLQRGGVQEQIAEVISLHKQRIKTNAKINYDNITDGRLKQNTEGTLQDAAFRSRIALMIIEVKANTGFMEDGLSLLRRHIKSTYAAELKAQYGALTNQDAAIESYFSKVVETIKGAARFFEIANEVIKDIDQNAYTLQRNQATAELVLGPRGRTN